MKLDDQAMSWLDDAVAWWLRELGPIGETLVVPSDEYFRDASPEGLFATTMKLADMADWNFELVEDAHVPLDNLMGNAPHPGFPIPQFEPEDGDELVPEGGPFPIAFRADDDALGKVASFARDMSHYLLQTVDDPASDDDERAAYVDVCAVMLGFGVFLANCSVRVGGGGQAAWSTLGVLDEPSFGYLVALFVELRGGDDKAALAHLAPNLRVAFKWSRDQLRGPRRSVVERLRTITPAQHDDGPYR